MKSIVAICSCLLLAPVWSEGKETTVVALVAENSAISAGETFYVGVKISHAPGEHTYWKFPGVVGLPTSVRWNLPDGFRVEEIQWPAPQAVKMADYTAQGYEGETLLIVPLVAPREIPASTVTITAKISWMACGNACYPAHEIPFSLTLPVAAKASTDAEMHQLFEKFRKRIPQPAHAFVKRTSGGFSISLDSVFPPASQRIPEGFRFFTSDGQVASNSPQVVRFDKNGRVHLELIAAETAPQNATSLSGVITTTTGSFSVNPIFPTGR